MSQLAEEIAEFIATGPSSLDVGDFQCSPDASDRIADLIRREKLGGLNASDTSELESALKYQHLMRLAKARYWESRSGH